MCFKNTRTNQSKNFGQKYSFANVTTLFKLDKNMTQIDIETKLQKFISNIPKNTQTIN